MSVYKIKTSWPRSFAINVILRYISSFTELINMVGCVVITCKRRSETSNLIRDGVSYHTFPKDPLLRKDWITFCKRNNSWVPARTSVICSDHFDSCSFLPQGKYNRRRLNESAKPTLFNKNPELNAHSSSDITQSSSKAPSESQVHSTDVKKIFATPRKIQLKKQLEYKCKKIKRLQEKNRYLKKKVKSLKELLNKSCEKSLIDKEEKSIVVKTEVEEK